jgi:DNA polymerase-1
LLADLGRAGGALYIQGGRIRYAGTPAVLTPALRARIDLHRVALLEVLGAAGTTGPPFTYVTTQAGMAPVLAALEGARRVGIDLETTGLNPRNDRLRLLSLAVPNHGVYLVDAFRVDIKPLFPTLAAVRLVGHHLAFDLAFLAALGFEPGKVSCTMNMAQLLDGTRQPGGAAWPKGHFGLAACCERELGRRLDKAQQVSDWSGPLTAEQLAYAAADVEVLLPLRRALMGKIKAANLAEVAELESRCLPAVVAMSANGVAVNRGAWTALAVEAEAERDRLAVELAATAPTKPEGGAWNWRSPPQVKRAFDLVGVKLENTRDETLATVSHPLAKLLRGQRSATKRADTYGAAWLQHLAPDGRVYADWRQLGADTGRMSCSRPGLQQLPRDPRYRGCFSAGPDLRFAVADYSQIELRLAARIAGDERMMRAFADGEDLHTLTARQLTGKDKVTAEERQIGKTANFALIYGCNAKRLAQTVRTQLGIDLGREQAAEYHAAFFRAWPGIAKWHETIRRDAYRAKMRQRCQGTSEVRTLTGRRVLMTHEEWHGRRANAIVQGSGGDAIKAALALLWERRAEVPGARVVLAAHDEIVLEALADQVEQVKEFLKRCMEDALAPMIDPVPAVVEVSAGRTWAMEDEGPAPDTIVEVDAAAPPIVVEAEVEQAAVKPHRAGKLTGPLKWHGGKSYLAKQIVALFPAHTHYVEPYAGGLAVLLAKDPEGVSEVANDLNGDLTNFWGTLRDEASFERFRRMAEATPFSETAWQEAGAHLADPDPVVRAFAFFVRVRQSMSGRGDCFAPLSRNRTRRGMNEQSSAWLNAVEGLAAVHERLKRVAILNRPAIEVIKSQDGPGTLFYCDPPYVHSTRATTREYGEHEMTEADHVELLKALRACKGKVALSGYRSALYEGELAGWARHEFEMANHAAGGAAKRRVTECLWVNW